MKVVVYGRPIHTDGFEFFLEKFTSTLDEKNVEYCFFNSYAEFIRHRYGIEVRPCDAREMDPQFYDLMITLGGDGTVLDTLSLVLDSGLPVLGINLGRFGFLANVKVEEIESAVDRLLKGAYSVESRSVIEVVTDVAEINEFPYALNDMVVQKRDTSAMITVDAYLDGKFMNSYWADGLIIATPTGSSGYSLSCGGPILFPGTNAFAFTPIAVHNLTVRPAVLPDHHSFGIEVKGRSDSLLVSLDSRSYKVPVNTKLTVKKADFSFQVIQLDGVNYMDTIRTKLMWGMDSRNES